MKFILNRNIVETNQSAGKHTLDFIRKMGYKGVKEGCHEGDCGACMVLVGELKGETVKYRAINSCILPLGKVEGKHVVTIEGLNLEHLNPVQQAIVDEGGSQCGYCTPGFVIALMAYFMNEDLTNTDTMIAIEGNICRCTGYNSILRAAELAKKNILALDDSNGRIQALIDAEFLPKYFLDIPSRLEELQTESKIAEGTFVAGGTDLFVHKDIKIEKPVFLTELGFNKIWSDEEFVYIGGAADIESIRLSKEMNDLYDTAVHLSRVSTLPIRQQATAGGNVVNASPIGDLTIYFLALNADISLLKDKNSRTIKLKDLFKGYKVLDLKEGEILEWFRIKKEKKYLSFEKVAKRMYMDIASVNSALSLKLEDGIIKEPHLSGGGVGPIPMYLEKTCQFLENKKITVDAVKEAARIADTEISPIDDVRGSAKYKRLLLRQLIYAHLIKLVPELEEKL